MRCIVTSLYHFLRLAYKLFDGLLMLVGLQQSDKTGTHYSPWVDMSVDQVNIFVQGRISRPINGSKLIFHMSMYLWDQQEYTRAMTSWPIFHGPLTSVFGQIIMVKIFVQGRILSSTNVSKLIFHVRMSLYEASRNIQDPWPIFHSLLTSDFGQFSMVKIFVISTFWSSVDGTCSNLIFY